MKFKPPKRIKIGGVDYKVQVWKGRHLTQSDRANINFQSNDIQIDPDVDAIQSLLHELCHGVERAMGMDLSEIVITQLSHHLRALIADNPVMFRRLADHLGGGK